ncbi:hypothetical protein D6817_05520 [Candidatus Pacearchaeota archaeon]|nr:MAG: hypothetical protein D6817_05520 [Candidatus Pacearchaeota archaeon]
MNKEVLDLLRERKLLLAKEVFDLVSSIESKEVARAFLDELEKLYKGKMITKTMLTKNWHFVKSFAQKLPGQDKTYVEKVFVKLGVSLEIGKEKEIVSSSGVGGDKTHGQVGKWLGEKERESKRFVSSAVHEKSSGESASAGGFGSKGIEVGYTGKDFDVGARASMKEHSITYKVFYANTTPEKKLEVGDFVKNFRARFMQLRKILAQRRELQANLVSMNKISSQRESFSLIGIVSEKHTTKNKNILLRLEDLTGQVRAVVRQGSEAFKVAEEVQLDDVIGLKVSGNREMVFVQEIYFPDARLIDRTRFSRDVWVAFVSDVHCGSDRHLKKSFNRFLEWLNSEDEIAQKIEFMFFVGDNVDGVGIFPSQEELLELKSMREQYQLLASYLKRVPKRVTMFMCPGQHDAVRVAEPQPLISKKYAPELYEIDNLVLVTNPTLVKLCEREKEFKVLMYHGASIHSFINQIKELREMKAHRCPAKAVVHMLKRRHLSPTHSESVYIPNPDVDPLVIDEVPDVLCTGEVHRLDIERYNGVLIITGSCWQAQTPFEEKVGNIPDPAKVPLLNLRTGQLKIYDFGDESEVGREW